jgi:hypothetical protein
VIGNWVHAALEAELEKQPFAGDQLWERLCRTRSETWNELKNEVRWTYGVSHDVSDDVHERRRAEELLKAALQSKVWKTLVTEWRCRAEVPLVHIAGDRLVQGRMDLLCEKNEGDRHQLLIVDFKTTPVASDTAASDVKLRAFAEEQGHRAQVQGYARTLRRIHPQA